MTSRVMNHLVLAGLLLAWGTVAWAGGTVSTQFPVYEQSSPILVTFANAGTSQIEATHATVAGYPEYRNRGMGFAAG